MKKSKLLIDYEYNFDLVGVASTIKGYRLAWEINNLLGTHLIKQPDLMVGFKNNDDKPFSFYSHETALNRLKLFKNRSVEVEAGKYFLIPEYPHFDFIILAALEDRTHQQLIDLIKSIPHVQLAASIPLEGLKSKSNFIF
jgi:hypothetical protein